MNFIHKLNDRATAILRNIPYPIRSRVTRFPPLGGEGSTTELVVLCEDRHFLEGCWSGWSWLRFLTPHVHFRLLVDGSPTLRQRTVFAKLFLNGRLTAIPELLTGANVPDFLMTFVQGHLYGRKLAALYVLQQESAVLYCDSDVLAFSRPDELIAIIQRGHQPAYLADSVGYTVDPWIRQKAEKIHERPCKNFNAGLVFLPRFSLRLDLLHALLEGWSAQHNSHFAEQTLLSVLVRSANGCPLPPERYVLSWDGVWIWHRDLSSKRIVSRHYTGPVRHRMYLSAYPRIAREALTE